MKNRENMQSRLREIEKAIEMLKSKMDGNTDTSYEWCETVRTAIQALQEKAEREKLQENCACMTNNKACCTCVSMRCHYCVKQSNYTKGSFCSTCGRKLNNATTDNI